MVSQAISLAPIYTIGHANHSKAAWFGLLARHGIALVADVRSQATSAIAHFNQSPLQTELAARGMRYLFLGRQLGGRPAERRFYDEQGHVRYDLLARAPEFLAGIKRLERESAERRVALVCAEEDPAPCHRRLLISRVLAERGIESLHIRGDGRVQTEEEITAELTRRECGQRRLFAAEEVEPWRSIRSVLPKRRPPTFSSGYARRA